MLSQTQNEKVISKVIKLLDENCQWGGITKPIEEKHDNATAHCQVFNNCALTTLTLAPDDVEDIPLEVEDEVFQYSKKFFKNSILIDAHNSISKTTILSKQDLTNLINVAKNAICKASLMKEFPFRIGFAEIHLNDFQLQQGIGPGGGFILLLEKESITQEQLIKELNIPRIKLLNIINQLENEGFLKKEENRISIIK